MNNTRTPQGPNKDTPASAEIGVTQSPPLGPTAVAPSANGDVFIGKRVGNYQIVERLGVGGFGAVYRARDEKLGRDAALKFLRDPLDAVHQELFEREAKAIAVLSKHPGIVQIYAWGEFDNKTYIALEFIDGSADKLLHDHQNGLTPSTALQITAVVADALEFAHSKGIIHRDVKPENILIEPGSLRPKLADFGMARLFESAGQSILANRITGSPRYMSPEQARPEPLDCRTDIFSLGVTLYTLLCGRWLYEGESVTTVIDRIRKDERVPLRERRPDLPEKLLQVVEKATTYDRNHRYASAAEFAAALRAMLQVFEDSDNEITVSRSDIKSVPVRKRRSVILAIVVFSLIVVLAGSFFRIGSSESSSSDAVLAAAVDEFNKGDATAARTRYAEYLTENPKDDKAHYGLGLALLNIGDDTAAESELNKIANPPLKNDGMAALLFEKGGPNARTSIEALATKSMTSYPSLLLARLDGGKDHEKEIAAKLEGLERSKFEFEWQYFECLQTLGQAYEKLGEHKRAAEVFDRVTKSPSASLSTIAAFYVERNRRMEDDVYRKSLDAKIDEVKKIISDNEKAHAQGDRVRVDGWTSRPLSFLMLPANAGHSRIAVEKGIVEWLPSFVVSALIATSPMSSVNRKDLFDALQEQSLSGKLGSKANQLHLGNVLGARILVQIEFLDVMDNQKVHVKLTNTETTQDSLTDFLNVPRNPNAEALTAEVTRAIRETVFDAFPIQGRVYRGANGLEINIGSSVGVRAGMRFVCASAPDPGKASLEQIATVKGAAGVETSSVELSGVKESDVQSDAARGLYVVSEDWVKQYLDRQR